MPEKYAVATNIGGLANRMKAIASALRFAGNDPSRVGIAWPLMLPRDDAYAEEVFENASEFRYVLRKRLTGPTDRANERQFDLWRLVLQSGDAAPMSSIPTWGLVGPNIDLEYNRIPAETRSKFLEAFSKMRPTAAIRSAVDRFWEANPDVTVGIQYRSCAWSGTFDGPGRVCKKETVMAELDRCVQKLLGQNPGHKFFVCSDSAEIRRELGAKYGAVSMDAFFGQDLPKGVQRAFADMLCLGRCPNMILSRSSTFGEVAWWLGGAKAKIVGLLFKHGDDPSQRNSLPFDEAAEGLMG